MNWTEIYNQVVYEVWGNSTPPEGTVAALQGANGIIAQVHRKIQEDYNYWFMETTWTTTLTDGVQSYVLPTLFKEVVQNGFQLIDVTSLDRYPPLSPMQPNDMANHFRDADYEADYPSFYEIYGGALLLYPMPSLTGVTLSARIYQYLARPPAVFDTTSDTLTINGADAIVYGAAARICKIQEEYQKFQVLKSEFAEELERLMQMDVRMRRAEINTCIYQGV